MGRAKDTKMETARISGVLWTFVLLTTLSSFSMSADAKYSGGTGEPNSPYQIATAEDLILLGENPEDYDKHFILTADIDLDPNLPGCKVFDKAVIAPDANEANGYFDGTSFTGVFNGNDHKISNLTIEGADYLGLFGVLSTEAIVSELVLDAVNINGSGDFVGGLASINGYPDWRELRNRIMNCQSTGVVKGGNSVGGLVGYNSGFIINSCSNMSVSGNIFVGGLAGQNVLIEGAISNCYSAGSVFGNRSVGGLAGQNGAWVDNGSEAWEYDGHIDNCYSTCRVAGTTTIGGLVGFNEFGVITQCYSTGTVSGNERIGGLLGENNDYVTICFWDVETSGLTSSAAGIGKTTAEMQTADTFTHWGTCGPLWTIDEGRDYPHLAWENAPGEFITNPYGGGAGTAEDPYLIYTAEQLNIIGLSFCDLDKHFKLMADIDLSAFDGKDGRPVFNVIGPGSWDAFTGVFDGNDHVISNLTLAGEDYLGMFGRLERGAEVRNLGVVDVNIVGSGSFIGALAGESNSDLTCCYSSGIVRGDWSVGGLVGASFGGIDWGPTVTQCHSTCEVRGNEWLGGLVGNNSAFITLCHSTGEISGRDRVGGLVGDNAFNTVARCYSTSAVSGDRDVGGLVGHNYKGSITTSYSRGIVSGYKSVGGLVGCNGRLLSSHDGSIITASYSTSMVIGNEDVGGLVGDHRYGRVTASFWDMETSGQITSAGGTGLATSAMQDINTYLNAGWDFVDETINGTCDYWRILPDDYPQLRYHADDNPVMPEGLGTAQEPYLIRDARDLGTVWFKPLAHYRLETSLDLSGIIWSMAVVPCFGGIFDGNGYVISNLQIQGGSYLGLFGELGLEAKLSNLGLEAVNVNGDWYVGGLAGKNLGSITNCYSIGTVTGHNYYVGGLIGRNKDGSITASHSTGTVSGDVWVGGLVGQNYAGRINVSYSTGEVNGNLSVGGLAGDNYTGSITASFSTATVSGYERVGGLVGYNFWGIFNPRGGIITTSYSTGNVFGSNRVGGLVGYNFRGSIVESYSTGTVDGNKHVGGLVGDYYEDTISHSFWDTETSGQTTSAGGTGKTTAEMQTAGTFLGAGWDFVDETQNGNEDIWWILEGQDYPRLWWENAEP